MNIWCRLGIHDFERASKPVPTRDDNEFHLVAEGYALGKCRKCPELRMVRCWGGLEFYYPSEVKTKAEWLRILSGCRGEG